MKKKNTKDHIQDLLDSMKLVKNCIKNNTAENCVMGLLNEKITFKTENNILIQIKLYK